MKRQHVYVDTSVIGGCHDDEFAPWSKGLMKDFRLGNFLPVISEVVDAEIKGAPDFVKETYEELRTLDYSFIHVTEEALQLAESYLQRKILTSKYSDDALHIALASVAEVDLLVSCSNTSFALKRSFSLQPSILKGDTNHWRFILRER